MANPITIPVTQTGFQQSIQAGAKAAGQINIPVNATFNAGSFNNLAQPLGRVTGLATEFEKSIAASNARVIAFGASVGIINGIQNAFASLITTTIEVQKNLALIGAISNKSGQELEKFGDNLFEIAKNTGQSFRIAAEAATEFARQGLTVEETLRRTSDALILTRFTTLSAADSVEALTAAVNSFSSAGITTADILNKLVAVDTKFAVSAADLANGLSRTGAIAEEVGVSFDELNGIITSVQEKTARGGAVIGNAFKTIFTNIRSENTIRALENIGIYSKNAEGSLRPVVPILKELAQNLNSLPEGKKLAVLESIASKYNINVLSALLKDINDAEGTFEEAKETSAGATIEAYQRQLELNKSLSVALNNVFVSSEKLANSIGRIGVTENLKGLLDFFGNLIDSVNDVVDSEGIGGNIARGLISGLGSIFFKIGIPVLAALFVVLTKNIIQFGSESLQTILGINSKVKERQALEQAVFNTLVQNQNVMANINALSGNRAKQEQYLLSIYNQQLAAIQKVRDVATSVAPALQSGGLSAITGQITKTGKRAAGGYLPAQEAADVSRGVGGASSSSKVVSIPNFAFGGGKKGTMIANTSEYIVPNYANGGSAIFNQDMVNSFGLPAGAKKLGAAGGYIPNFVNEKGVAPEPAGKGREFEKRVRDFFGLPNDLPNAVLDFNPGVLDTIPKDKKEALGVKGPWGDLKLNYNEYAKKSMLAKLISYSGSATSKKIMDATIAGKESVSLNEIGSVEGATLFYKSFNGQKNQSSDTLNQSLGQVLKEGFQNSELLNSFNPIRVFPGDKKKVSMLTNDAGKKMASIRVTAKAKLNSILDPESFQTGAASLGYIPNFADPLKAAVEREMAAGLDPAQIRITKDARLKNGKNPEGFAVINTRDEPDGKIPNFSKDKPIQGAGMFGSNRQDKREALNILDSTKVQQKRIESSNILETPQNRLAKEMDLAISSYRNGTISLNNLIEMTKYLASDYKLTSEAQKKLVASTEENASKIKVNTVNSEKSKGATSTEGKAASTDKKGFDIGKFLILQSALVGLTSAVQSYTEENTKASAALETASAAGSIAISAFSLPFKANPVIAAVALLATGIGALVPVVSKWQEALKTDADRAAESLFKLATQARKTGENLTPEAILNALKLQKAQEKDKKELDTYSKDVRAAFDEKNLQGLGEDEIKNIAKIMKDLGIAQGSKEFTDFTANIGYEKKGGFDQLKSTATNATVFAAAKGFNILTGIDTGRAGKFDNAYGIKKENLTTQTEIAAKRRTEDLKLGRALPTLSNSESEKASKEYQTLKVNDALARSITDNAINSQNTYSSLNILLKKEGQQLEINKNLRTESLYLEEKRLLAIRQAANELAKNNAESEASFREAIDFGKNEGKTGISSASLSRLNLDKLVESYTENGLEGLNETFQQESTRLNKQGVKTQESLSQLASSDVFIKAIQKKSEQNRTAQSQYDTSVQEASIKPQTEVQKLGTEYKTLSLALEKGGQYIDLLGIEQQKLTNSVVDAKLKNLLLVETANERAQSELDIALANEKTKKEIFKKIGVDKEAQTDASKLRTSTLEKIRQFQKDIINANEKFEIDSDLIQAESEYLTVLYDIVSVEREAAQEGKKLALQSKKNRRQSEITALNQKLLFDEDVDQLRSKIKVKESFNKLVKQDDLTLKAFLELESSSYDLAEAQRSLAARLNPKNLEYETSQNKTKTLIDSRNSVTDALSSGNYGRSGFERESAKIDILRKRSAEFGGVDNMSQDQIDKIQQGKYSIKDNLYEEGKSLIEEAKTFQQILGQDTPKALADGLAQAMQVGLSGADNIGEALQNIAKSFLQTLQTEFLQSASKKIVGSTLAAIGGSEGGYVKKFAAGGMVTGGSGIRDDVPAMLSAGEYVMRKSAVQKYGSENIAKMNNGGIFLPGVRGGSAISGYDQLSKFANQTTTSGATDVLKGSGSTAFANLEDQSARLSRFGLMNEDTIKGEITSAQQQGLDLISKREAYRTQQRKAMQQQIVGTIIAAAITYGAGKLGSPTKTKPKLEYGQDNFKGGIENLNNTVLNNQGAAGQSTDKYQYLRNMFSESYNIKPKKAYGGMIRGFNNGGGPTDDIPALLMGGEYVMDRATTRKYGKQYLDSMNSGRARRFAEGGYAGAEAETATESSDSKAKVDSKTGTAVNISINVSGSGSSTESQGQTSQGGVDYKKMGERIKAVVLETINEEKRLGGALRSR